MLRIFAKLPTVSLKLSDGSIYPLKGRIETVSGIIDTQTGSSNMRATFENPNRLLRSGGSGVIMIPMKTAMLFWFRKKLLTKFKIRNLFMF